MNKPEVSIIMPCYNVGRYVETAIKSVLNQNVPSQIIAVDDGSEDNTLEVLSKFSSNIQILKSDHLGVAHSRNKAIEYIEGKFTLLLDSDDALAPFAIAHLLTEIGNKKDAVAYGAYSSWDHSMMHRLYFHSAERTGKQPLALLARRNISPPGAILFPSVAFKMVGQFDQEVAGCEDWDFIIRMARAGFSFNRVNKEVFYYRRVPFSASNQALKMLDSGLRVIKRCHSRDERIINDKFADGFFATDMEANLFTYHAVCLAISSCSDNYDITAQIVRRIPVPTQPDWQRFGIAFRLSLLWNSVLSEGPRNYTMMTAQKHCVDIIMKNGKQAWKMAMIKSILFPDLKSLLLRPGPKKALRLFNEWNIARKIYKNLNTSKACN